MLVVQALSQLEHAGGGGGLLAPSAGSALVEHGRRHHRGDRSDRGLLLLLHNRLHNGGLRDPARGRVAELGHTPVGSLELGLEVRILSLQLAHRLNDLVEELVDLVLLVALAELGRLELLVEDVVCRQQRHGRHLGVVTEDVTVTGSTGHSYG